MKDQGELFRARQFHNIEQKKKFAASQLENAAQHLEGQGVDPLFIAHALFDLYNRYNDKGLKQLSEQQTES